MPQGETDWLAQEVEGMAVAWSRGERPLLGAILDLHPGLDDEAAIRLIYEDVCLRRESGLEVATSEVVGRFPRWREELEVLLQCDRLMRPPVRVHFPDVGERLGEYQLLAELGRGTSGRTFLATQPALADRPVVLKVMPREHEEHLSLARLQHTNIVPLYAEQVFADRGLRALCMPSLGGANLGRILDALADLPLPHRSGRDFLRSVDEARGRPEDLVPIDGPFRRDLARASYVQAICWVAACLADALQYAHDRGLIHMDIKPSNVLIAGDGQPMLLDFHLARGPIAAGESWPGRLGGTAGWMAPEHESAMEAVGQGRPVPFAVDGRSDIYSLGLLLKEALGNPRAKGPGAGVRPNLCNPQVSIGLADIVEKCLAPDAELRYQDASALADDLRRHLQDLPLRGVDNRSMVERWRKWKRRRPQALARWSARASLLVAAVVVVAVGAATYSRRVREIETALADARRFQEARHYPEAIRASRLGRELARRTPTRRDLPRALDAQLRRALRGQMAGELHALADLIRLRYGIDPPPSEEVRSLVGRCRKVWEARRVLAEIEPGTADQDLERTIKADLLELAIVWSDFRVRLAATGDRAAVRQDVSRVLDEAESSFGPSLSLTRLRDELALEVGHRAPGRSTEPAPRSAADHYDLGRSYLRNGQVADAVEEFRRAIEQRPQDFWPNFYQGLCAYRLERFDDALGAFRACITLAPFTAECYYNRALVHEALGRIEPAVRDYTRALELDGRLTSAALNRGILSFKAGRFSDAIADFERALDAPADQALRGRIEFHMALLYLERSDRSSAMACLGRAAASGNRQANDLRDRLLSGR